MSQLIAVPQACQTECSSTGTSGIPGPAGANGTNGAAGASGVSAFTTVALYDPPPQPLMPDGSVAGTVVVNTTSSTAWMALLQVVFVQNWGWMQVVAIPSDTSVTLLNLEDGSGTYDPNAPAGTSLAAASRIVPGGLQGVTGLVPGGALLSANDLSDVASVINSRTSLGLGDAAQATIGIGNGNVVMADGALNVGGALLVTATGVETPTDAAFRTAVGLGTMAVQDANAVAITGGALNGTLGAGTPATAAVTTLVASSTASIIGDSTLAGKLFTPSTAIQTLAAANTISPNAAFVRVAGSGGAVTLVSTPTITNPVADGQRLIIMGTDDTNTVTLQDKSALGGSNLNLAGNANVVLGEGDTIELIWQSTLAGWYELCRSNN